MPREMGRYKVVGKRTYREHPPGTTFEAHLEPDAEARAINRGSIKLIRRLTADLPSGKWRLPADVTAPERKIANG